MFYVHTIIVNTVNACTYVSIMFDNNTELSGSKEKGRGEHSYFDTYTQVARSSEPSVRLLFLK